MNHRPSDLPGVHGNTIMRLSLAVCLAIVLWNSHLDPDAGVMRMVFTAVSLVVCLVTPRKLLLYPLALVTCFEIPTLRMGYPNQFLSDCLIIAWMTGVTLRNHKPDRNLLPLALHPYLGTLAILATMATGYFLVSLEELQRLSYSGLSFVKIVESLVRRLFLWDVHDPLHNASVIFGYTIQCLFIVTLWQHRRFFDLNSRRVMTVILVGAVVNGIYGILQWVHPSFAPIIYTVDIGGLLQNGNLLSFLCGLGIICALALWSTSGKKLQQAWLLAATLPLALGLILGRGRLPWIAMGIVATLWFLAMGYRFLHQGCKGLNRGSLLKTIPLLTLICMTFGYSWVKLGLSQDGIIKELLDALKSREIARFLTLGAREAHFLVAIDMAHHYPLQGIGLHSFFTKGGQKLEAHSIVLMWLTGVGGGGLIMALISVAANIKVWVTMTWRKLTKDQETAPLVLGMMLLFIGITHLGDIPMSYRSLFTVCSLVATSFLLSIIQNVDKNAIKIRSTLLGVLSLIAACWSLASAISPQTLPMLTLSYPKEKDTNAPGGSFNWNAMVRLTPLGPMQCLSAQVKPVSPEGVSDLVTGVIDPEALPPPFASVTTFKSFETHLEHLESFDLSGGKWTSICLCNPTGQSKIAYLRGSKGEILSMSKLDFGIDPRFISFGIGTESIVSQSSQQCARLSH